MYKAHSVIQDLLPDNAIYAVSNEYTTADVAIAPSMARTDVCLRNDLGAFKEGEGKKIYEVLKGEKYAKINRYFDALTARKSLKSV